MGFLDFLLAGTVVQAAKNANRNSSSWRSPSDDHYGYDRGYEEGYDDSCADQHCDCCDCHESYHEEYDEGDGECDW